MAAELERVMPRPRPPVASTRSSPAETVPHHDEPSPSSGALRSDGDVERPARGSGRFGSRPGTRRPGRRRQCCRPGACRRGTGDTSRASDPNERRRAEASTRSRRRRTPSLLLGADFGQEARGHPIHGRPESEDGGADDEPGPRLKVGAVRTRRFASSEGSVRPSGSGYGNPSTARGTTPLPSPSGRP